MHARVSSRGICCQEMSARFRDADKEKGRRLVDIGLFVLLILVRLAGIEPTTPWFVAKYSIQLSYSRIEETRV